MKEIEDNLPVWSGFDSWLMKNNINNFAQLNPDQQDEIINKFEEEKMADLLIEYGRFFYFYNYGR